MAILRAIVPQLWGLLCSCSGLSLFIYRIDTQECIVEKKEGPDPEWTVHMGQRIWASRKHTYIILTPLNPILYSKTGVYMVYIIFLILPKNIDCGYSLEVTRQAHTPISAQSSKF